MKNTCTKAESIIVLIVCIVLFIYGTTQLYKAVSATNYTATVSYTNAVGKKQTTDVLVDERFQHELPNPGDELSILVSKSGEAIEDEGYRQIGGSLTIIGAMGLGIVIIPPLIDCFWHKFLKESSKGENKRKRKFWYCLA